MPHTSVPHLPDHCNLAWTRLTQLDQQAIIGLPDDQFHAVNALINNLVESLVRGPATSSRDDGVPPDHPQVHDLVTALDLLDHPATDSTGNHLVAAAEAIDVAISQLPDLPCVEFERQDLNSIMKSLLGKAGA